MKTKTKRNLVHSKFLYLFLFIFLFSLNFVNSSFGYNSDSTILNLGTFKQGDNINLVQTCSNCSYNNITKIKIPDGTILNINSEMEKEGTFYNYTFSNSYLIGEYQVNGIGNLNGVEQVWNYSFKIGGGSLGLFVIMFIVFYGLSFYGIVIKNEWVSLFGCFGLLILGLYVSFNGMDLYKNNLTDGISYITIGLGLGIGFEALRKITDL
jgi:hypothetical protein